MAKKQTISFTALPNGIAPSGKLRLSVFVSPRLWTDAGPTTDVSLTEFPDWVDWPSTALTFGVKIGGSDATGVVRVGDAPRSDLWTGLFPAGTSLRPRTFDTAVTLTHIQSYSVKDVHTKIRQIYSYFAKNNPENFPTISELLDEDSPLRDIATPFFPPDEAPPPPAIKSVMATSAGYDALRKVETFHKPFLSTKQTVAPPEPDFHQMLAALGRYPALMRMLGLVHDLEVDHPGAVGATTVEATASWPGAPAMPHMKTRCFVGPSAFYATPRAADPEISGDGLGMLKLNDTSAYEIVQVNQDGAAIRTLRFAETFVRATFDRTDPLFSASSGALHARSFKTDDTPTAYALPSASTAGLAVARVNSADKLKSSLTAQAAKNATLEALGDVMLDAEDITRGYAIDVHDGDSGKWHSLCERIGTYRIGGVTLPAVQDEGFITLGLAMPADGTTADSKLPETLFNWYGWSLAAPKPGKAMDEDGQPVAVEPTNTTNFDLRATFVAKPGSLPKLRFGTDYRLRARAVDLAGNTGNFKEMTGLDNATEVVTYGRYEPVSSPEVVLDDKLGEGDALGRVVIRSNFDTKADVARRHISPPKAAETMAETLGSFDTANGGLDAGAYKLLETKDGGSWQLIGRPDPHHPGVFYVKEEDRKLPYLPDALSRGAVLRGLPGTASPMKVGFGYDRKSWPDALLFTLLLREGSGAPSFAESPRYLVVELGKADVATVRLSSYLDPDRGDIDRMGLLRWLEQEFPADVDAFRAQVANGTHWMVTPFKTLTLVHAVRQPLMRPRYLALAATKLLGNTFASIADPTMELSRKSTVRLDIVAQWTEFLDALSQPGPQQVPTQARPFQFNVPLAPTPAQETSLNVTGKHEFGDTKYRRVSYSAHATSRFAEYFAQRMDGVTLTAGTPLKLNAPVVDDGENWGGVVAGSEVVTAADRSAGYARDVDYTMDYMAGTLTPNASLSGKSVNITFVAPPIARKTASPVDLDVPSSARPDAPKVLYLVPTFGWTQNFNKEGTSYVSERRGGGLRAYLDRPWFSSGEGELLGVVIWSGATPLTETVKPFVSDWGLDPMYQSAPTTAAPTVGAFTMATNNKTSGLSLEELPGVTTLHVAGHPVAYDNDRRLWYCDLEIDAGASYFPFVRLALARYQPNSVQDAHLSRVVMADFVQLTANRTASLTRDPKQSDVFNVAVSGLSYTLLQSAAGPSIVEVSVEGRGTKVDASDMSELGWEQVPGTSHALTPSAGPAGTTVWTGQAILPKAPPGRYRIVITEFEQFGATAAERRLVYADAIIVDK